MRSSDTPDPDDPEHALREVRGRFVAAFTGQCESIGTLLAGPSPGDDPARSAGLNQLVHRLTGLAGTVGFPTVSARAGELEALLLSGIPDLALARELLNGIREAFAGDLVSPPGWAISHGDAGGVGTVLIVEDDPDQLAVLEIHLHAAGHRTVAVTRGNEALDTIAEVKPSVVLLDVDLPGVDGYTICRVMKTSPELASIPVVFVTTRNSINARLSGLTLGADDYLCKPIDPRELLVRIGRLTSSAAARTVHAPSPGVELSFDAFSAVGQAQLAREGAAVALVRVPPLLHAAVLQLMTDDSRRRDAIGRYDEGHLFWLLPGTSSAQALSRVRDAVARIRGEGFAGVTAGVAAGPAGSSLPVLLAEADEALAQARYLEEPASVKGGRPESPARAIAHSLVLADDDPEVARIVDAQMRAAGFRTVLAFDGARALEAVVNIRPDVLVLDLMMPVMTGFDVLRELRDQPVRPRIVVLSARGREDDVTRAFELGADDYIVKPFSPQELRARIERLVR